MMHKATLYAAVLVLFVGVMTMMGSAVAEAAKFEMNSTQWAFVGGEWQQDADGIITAPGNDAYENLAFLTTNAYQDFEAEFEFYWDVTCTTAGFIFRAQDAQHYYVVDFPTVGQSYRAENFWATVAKVDERGWREGLHMQAVHGVSSAIRVWHQAKVKVTGNEIRVWVDGRPLAVVRDDTYAGAGCIGLATYTAAWSGAAPKPKASFRNLRIQGHKRPSQPWDASIQPRRTWSALGADGGRAGTRLGRDADGTLLAQGAGGWTPTVLMMSQDNGRTWTPAEGYGGIPMRLGPGNRWENYSLVRQQEPFSVAVSRQVSSDKGNTWSESEQLCEFSAFPEKYAFTDGSRFEQDGLLEMRDGALLLYGFTYTPSTSEVRGGRYFTSGSYLQGTNFCMRSTDGGNTWAGPYDLDGPPYNDKAWLMAKEALEVSMAETAGGRLMALIRPARAQTMWESTSEDGGVTWTPLSHGPFPMYASVNSMVGTQSGALVIGGRFPGISLQVSHDGGMTWTFHTIDCGALWANGAMMEVEPDVVLYIYGGPDIPNVELRYQLFRVTPTGLEPIQ